MYNGIQYEEGDQVQPDCSTRCTCCTDTVRVLIPNENLNILLGRGGGGTVTIIQHGSVV